MINRQDVEKQASELRRQEIARLTHELISWLGAQLRTRHEAALRKPVCKTSLRSVNPTPV